MRTNHLSIYAIGGVNGLSMFDSTALAQAETLASSSAFFLYPRVLMKRVLHWFRRDLRVTDSTALHHACGGADGSRAGGRRRKPPRFANRRSLSRLPSLYHAVASLRRSLHLTQGPK